MHAAPHYHKLCSRVSRIWRHRRSQHTHSAMAEPRCGRTTFVITVSPLSGSSVLFSQLSRVRFFAIPGKYEVILPAARTALDTFTVRTGSLCYCHHLFHHRPHPIVSRASQALLTTLLIKSKSIWEKLPQPAKWQARYCTTSAAKFT